MQRNPYLLASLVLIVGASAYLATAWSREEEPEPPSLPLAMPEGYRDWTLISVAHEEGDLNDIRAILGNDIAVNAYRNGVLPFPDGTILARLAWKYVESEENNKIFGRRQSWIAGDPTDVQFMVKDSTKYAADGGWGFAQFDDGVPADETLMRSCVPCHLPTIARDGVFTRYAR